MPLGVGDAIFTLPWDVLEFLVVWTDHERAGKERFIVCLAALGLLLGIFGLLVFLYPRLPSWQLVLIGGLSTAAGAWFLLLLSTLLLDARLGDSWRKHSGSKGS